MLMERHLPPEVETFSLLATKNPKSLFPLEKGFILTFWKKKPNVKNLEKNQPNDLFPKNIFNLDEFY